MEVKRFEVSANGSKARYLRVLESIYNALVQDTVITKRAIYYGDVELFGSQKVVDQVNMCEISNITGN